MAWMPQARPYRCVRPRRAKAARTDRWPGRHAALRQAIDEAPHGRRAHPTPEHYWPLVVIAGVAGADVLARVIEGGIEHGVRAMDGLMFGGVVATGAPGPAS